MPTMRLVPSTYSLSSTTYLSIGNASNMYNNTDNTTYATITNSRSATTSYYAYIKGFNFDAVPSNAVVESFSIKLKIRESGGSTSTSYSPKLANNTTALTSTCAAMSTTATTNTFTGYSLTWDTLKGYGANFGIRIDCRRASRNTTSYIYIYGAEIEVTYSVPNPITVTSSLNGNGSIDPSGATVTYEGESYTLTISPDNDSDEIKVTKNGVDVSSSLVKAASSNTLNCNLGTYTLVSGSINSTGGTFFSERVGYGSDASTTSSNYYSGSSSTQAVFTYSMAFTGIPSNAIITRVYVQVSGHAESTSNANEYMCAQLKSGSTAITEQLNFKSTGSTSNSVQTLEATTLPTVSQLASMVLECTLGYYGGAINGATAYVEYTLPTSNYTYAYTVGNTDDTIIVTIGSAAASDVLYFRDGNNWVAAVKAYKKINNVWVEQTDLTSVFSSDVNYLRG